MLPLSVVISVYNAGDYLMEALESIFHQTYPDFECIIVDDGSTDGTKTMLEHVADPRVRVITNERNMGVARSLNRGLRVAQGTYIARMDADDVAHPDRFEKQVAFLEQHPAVGIVGCAVRMIDSDGKAQGEWGLPTGDLQIRWMSLLTPPFIHPTVMLRRAVLSKYALGYDETFLPQDYELWVRMLKYTAGANLREILLSYRIHQANVTSTRPDRHLHDHDSIAWRTIHEHLPRPRLTMEQVSQLRTLFYGGKAFIPITDAQRLELGKLYLEMFATFAHQHTGHPDLPLLRRHEVLRVAQLLFHRPLPASWLRFAALLLTIDPGVLEPLYWAWVRRMYGRLRRQFLPRMTEGFVPCRHRAHSVRP